MEINIEIPTEELTSAIEQVLSDTSIIEDAYMREGFVKTEDVSRMIEDEAPTGLDDDDVRAAARDEIREYDYTSTIDDWAADDSTFLRRADVDDVAQALLESRSRAGGGRCALGKAFQEAVLRVLRNVVDGTLPVAGLTGMGTPGARVVCHNEVNVDDTAEDVGEPAATETVQERHLRLRNDRSVESVDGPFGFRFAGDPTIYVYPTQEQAAAAYRQDDRPGDGFFSVVIVNEGD